MKKLLVIILLVLLTLPAITALIRPGFFPSHDGEWMVIRLSAFHQFTIRITEDFSVSREEFISRMSAKGITTAIYYPRPLHLYPHMAHLGYNKGDFPVAEQAAKEVVSLPVHPTLTDSEIEYMIETIKDIAYA